MTSHFEQIGGADALRPIIEDFTARVFGDVMIGFLFHGKNHARITAMEYLFAAKHLGADIEYTGRTMRNAHRSSPIMGGHFMRRRQILANTLADHDVDPAIVASWLAHVDSLREQVMEGSKATASECNHSDQLERMGPIPDEPAKETGVLTRLPVFGD